MNKSIEDTIKERFNQSCPSTRFYDFLADSSLCYETKIKYSKVNWENIPLNSQRRILKGLR